jgi:hypothetical protein
MISAPSGGYLRVPIFPHASLHLADESTQFFPIAFPTGAHLLEEVFGRLHEASLPALCKEAAPESSQVILKSD